MPDAPLKRTNRTLTRLTDFHGWIGGNEVNVEIKGVGSGVFDQFSVPHPPPGRRTIEATNISFSCRFQLTHRFT